MGFMTTLLGRPGAKKPPTILEAQDALTRLGAERDRAKAEIADLRERRRKLLLLDDTDSEISKLDADIGACELKLERLDEAEPALIAALDAARDRARREKWQSLNKKYVGAADRYLKSARAARADLDELLAVFAAADVEGFSRDAAALWARAPNVLADDLLAVFERGVERVDTLSPPEPTR